MSTLLDRFLQYVKIDTQSDETSSSSPSTAKQLDLCKLLAEECTQLGLENVEMQPFGTVFATIPATVSHTAPTIAWVAHVDTSPEYSGTNVQPLVHKNYDGHDIPLPQGDNLVLRVQDNPALQKLIGGTVITTDGSTLLGADDKSGIAVMMAAAEYLLANPEIPHGEIQLCFTCDEEIGRGIENLDLDRLNAVCGYTLDSDGVGRIDSETFSADQAVVTIIGINTHPSIGKDVMVNAARIMSDFISQLPTDEHSPETTDGRQGFMHPYHIEAAVPRASARIILRDFETENLKQYHQLLENIAEKLRSKHPQAGIQIEIHEQYRNMREGLKKEPRAIELAIKAVEAAGIKPELSIIRGGTDGSLLTEQGLPTPNLSSGQHNPHSPLEWTSVEEMQQAVDILIELAKLWGQEST